MQYCQARCSPGAQPELPRRMMGMDPSGSWGFAMDDSDHLYDAFSAVYLDLCNHGICRYDPDILEQLWLEFLRDMQKGFISLFSAARAQ
jgi:hypothetical protein